MKIKSVETYFVRPRWGFVEIVTEENKNPHNWKNPVWHHPDGSVAEW